LFSIEPLFDGAITMVSTDVLFEPFRLKHLTLPNRIVMAPMTRSKSPGQIIAAVPKAASV
jgi:2,4-dienoyl-CoA reductase-like NADH-dependent reductase (Old Yellow Enzyme family)